MTWRGYGIHLDWRATFVPYNCGGRHVLSLLDLDLELFEHMFGY